MHFLKENVYISIKISLNLISKGPINNDPALVQIIAWHRQVDKPLSEPLMSSLPTRICDARPQRVKSTAASAAWTNLRYVAARNTHIGTYYMTFCHPVRGLTYIETSILTETLRQIESLGSMTHIHTLVVDGMMNSDRGSLLFST